MKSGLLVDEHAHLHRVCEVMQVDAADVASWHLLYLHPLSEGSPSLSDCPVHNWADCIATYAMRYPDGWVPDTERIGVWGE